MKQPKNPLKYQNINDLELIFWSQMKQQVSRAARLYLPEIKTQSFIQKRTSQQKRLNKALLLKGGGLLNILTVERNFHYTSRDFFLFSLKGFIMILYKNYCTLKVL